MAGLGGFRNVLVHGYLDIDSARVLDAHERAPNLFSEFRVEIERWVAAHCE